MKNAFTVPLRDPGTVVSGVIGLSPVVSSLDGSLIQSRLPIQFNRSAQLIAGCHQ